MPLRSLAARAALPALAALLASCATIVPEPRESVSGHVGTPAPAAAASTAIPRPVTRAPTPLPPRPAPPAETYTVVVNGVPVRELLFALARDASLNVDIHPRIVGSVTLNAIDQTLPQILERLKGQVDLRYKLDGDLLTIEPDEPFLRTYVLDYITLERNLTNTVTLSTQVTGDSNDSGGGGGGGSNTSTTELNSSADHEVWNRITEAVGAIVEQPEPIQGVQAPGVPAPAPSAESAADSIVDALTGTGDAPAPAAGGTDTVTVAQTSVFANPEAGLLLVRATERQHEQVQEYLDRVSASLSRQVLVEATVVEVTLSDRYRAGIDWSALSLNAGFSIAQSAVNLGLGGAGAAISGTAQALVLQYADQRDANGVPNGDLAVTARLLEEFGDVRVVSSPKVMTLNNQTAVLKVVDNQVYFDVDVETIIPETGTPITNVETTPVTVPVGFVMAVTPQISASDSVTLNVRPTVTQILGTVQDPNPAFQNTVGNAVPILQVREFESILRTQSGQIAVLGGLMRDSVNRDRDGIPWLSDLEDIGDIFASRDNQFEKSELVVFIRPWVVRRPSVLAGDLRTYERYLPENLGDSEPAQPPAQAPGRKP